MGVDMIFIFLLALILFGPKRLPEIARQVGKYVGEFKRASNDFKSQLQAEIETADRKPATPPAMQQSAGFEQTILPPAYPQASLPASGSLREEDDRERLLRTARMAFDAQNMTLMPPPVPTSSLEPPPMPASAAAAPAEAQPLPMPVPTEAAQATPAPASQPEQNPAPNSTQNEVAQRS